MLKYENGNNSVKYIVIEFYEKLIRSSSDIYIMFPNCIPDLLA